MRALDTASLTRWKSDPIAFVEQVLCDPETGKPFVLCDAERAFLRHAFTLDADGACSIPSWCSARSRKAGKTTLAALVMLTMVLLYGGGLPKDMRRQRLRAGAVARVRCMVRRIVEASPLLRGEAKITADRITFPALDASIMAIASDAASAAGGKPDHLLFRRTVGLRHASAAALWDEMITSPARKISCRLTVTYAGFTGESRVAGRDVQARHGAARGRSFAACRRWHAVRLAHRADRAVADRSVAGGDAPQPAAQCLCAHDPERVRHRREPVRRYGAWDACVQPR